MGTRLNQFWKSSDSKLSISSTKCDGVHWKCGSELESIQRSSHEFCHSHAANLKRVPANSLTLRTQQRRQEKTNKILKKLENYFAPTRNVLYEHYLFHSAQQPNKNVDQYISHLWHLAKSCKFGVLHNEMVRDRLILGCRDKGAAAWLFKEKECILKKPWKHCKLVKDVRTAEKNWRRGQPHSH